MARIRTARLLAAALLCALSLSGVAPVAAGPLRQTVDGARHQSGQDRPHHPSGGGSSGGHGGYYPAYYDGWYDGGCLGGPCPYYQPFFPPPYPYIATTTGPALDFEIYLGLGAVIDSDGVGVGRFRAAYDHYGIGAGDSVYVEGGEGGERSTELHVWDVHGGFRLLDSDSTIWLTAGLAGAHARGLSLFGAVGGVEARHQFTSLLGMEASVRGTVYQDNILAWEARAALAVSLLRVGYRVLDFTTGPPLRGPEIGVALFF